MRDTDREREWLDSADSESSSSTLPRPDLNPLVNPVLGKNMGRWAEVYFTSPPEEREHAVEKLLHDLDAEAGGKKAPPAQASVERKPVVAAPRIVESELEPYEPVKPRFTTVRRATPESADRDVLVCPGCFHKNAAEQRFCGICGFSLTQEPAMAPLHAATETMRPQRTPIETSESDWQWLRQRTLRDYESVQETNSGSRLLVGVIVLLALVAGAYFAWQNRGRVLHQLASDEPPAAAEAARNPSMEISMPTPTPAPQPAAPEHVTRTVPPPPAAPAHHEPVSASPAPGAAPARLQAAPATDNGSDELEQGRRYLSGEGVPKNSWVASQWLWKSVAKQNTDAVLLLSELYVRGDGVPRSCEQARVLLVASAKKGSPAAAQKLRSVETSCR